MRNCLRRSVFHESNIKNIRNLNKYYSRIFAPLQIFVRYFTLSKRRNSSKTAIIIMRALVFSSKSIFVAYEKFTFCACKILRALLSDNVEFFVFIHLCNLCNFYVFHYVTALDGVLDTSPHLWLESVVVGVVFFLCRWIDFFILLSVLFLSWIDVILNKCCLLIESAQNLLNTIIIKDFKFQTGPFRDLLLTRQTGCSKVQREGVEKKTFWNTLIFQIILYLSNL